MLGAFVGILVSNLACTTSRRSESHSDLNRANWLLHKIHIDSIHANAEDLENVERTVDMCVMSAYYETSVRPVPGPYEDQYRLCIFPPDELLEDRGWPEFLRWCSMEEISNEYRKAIAGATPYEGYVSGLDATYPGWKCYYKDAVSDPALVKEYTAACDEIDSNVDYIHCGSSSDGSFRWDSWESDPQGSSTVFTMALYYTVHEATTVCPGISGAFGSALGFLGLVELVATLLLAGFMILTGCAQPLRENASFMNLIKGAGIASISSEQTDVLKARAVV
jgi:hypothetical protein